MTAGFVSVVIDRLTRQYPKLIIRVTQDELVAMRDLHLRERKFELGIGRIPSSFEEEEIDAEILFKEPAFVVAGVGNKWVHRRKIELAELIDEPWILPPPEALSGSQFQQAFRVKGLDYPPRSTVVALSSQMTVSLVATGRYLGILPGGMLRFCGKRLSLKVLPVNLPIQPKLRPVGILTQKNRTLSPVAQLFIDCAREVAKPLAPWH
jgi:DNA-binding transcriptional LysR family regulator